MTASSAAAVAVPTAQPDASTGETLPAGASTTFVFANLVFKAPGARFVGQGPSRTPMFAIDLGDTNGLLSIQALKRQFNIAPDSPDDRMISLAVRSLKYVADIEPGDNIPNEILNGSASWTIDRRHTEVARKKLELQLLSSVDEKQVVLHSTAEITAYLEQPENKAKLRQAFREAAKAMGRPEDDHAYVLEKIATIARELAYIEALREWFLQVGGIYKKVQFVIQAYDSDRRVKSELTNMRPLLMTAASEYRSIFAKLDKVGGDVIATLATVAEKVAVIRAGRDELHQLTLIWSDVVAQWKGFTREQAPRFLAASQATYRFLATRHSSGHSMMDRGKPAQKPQKAKPLLG